MTLDLMTLVETRVLWAMHHRALPYGDSWRRPVPGYSLWLVRDGVLEVTVKEHLWRVESGAAFLISCRHGRDITIPTHAEWLTIGLNADLPGRDLLAALGPPLLWKPDEMARVRLDFYLSEIVRLFGKTGAPALMLEGLGRAVSGLLLETHGEGELAAGRGAAPLWLGRVRRAARENPGIGVAELAREAGFSPAQFRRVFHQWAGVAPHQFLQRERLERARLLLENTDSPIEEIGRQCGFSDASAFTRTFRAFSSLAPAAYRSARRLSREQA